MADDPGIAARLAAIRDAFDATFARPMAPSAGGAGDRVVVVHVGSTQYAVRLDECSAMVPLPSVQRLPSTLPAFGGIARVSGALVPVYELARLLQIDSIEGTRRWLIVTAGEDRVGFIADSLDGHGELEERAPAEQDATPVVRINGTDCRLLRLAPLVAALRQEISLDS